MWWRSACAVRSMANVVYGPNDPQPPDPGDGPITPLSGSVSNTSAAFIPISRRPRPTGTLHVKYLDNTAPVEPVDNTGRERGLTAAQPGDPIPYVFGETLVTPLIIAVAVYAFISITKTRRSARPRIRC